VTSAACTPLASSTWYPASAVDEEFHKDWQRLEKEAVATLELRPKCVGFTPECHALILSSFEDCTSYTLMVPWHGEAARPTGIRRIWRRQQDLAKFETPTIRLRYGAKVTPTLDEREVFLEATPVDELLSRVAGLTVPVRLPPPQVGADGTGYVLLFGELFLASRFQWWEHAPVGWKGLEAFLQETRQLIDSAVP
jgi:hypothetical protein